MPQLGRWVLWGGGKLGKDMRGGFNYSYNSFFLLLLLVIMFKLFECPKLLMKNKTKQKAGMLAESRDCPETLSLERGCLGN